MAACCGLSAVDDARRVADRLGIPYYVMNFKQEFKKNVMDYFTAEYLKGRTPNPCIACNRYVKWEALLNRSPADWCGLYCNRALCEDRAAFQWPICDSKFRDSSERSDVCALQSDTGTACHTTLMPVGAYHKDEIRKIRRGDWSYGCT